MSVVYKGTKNSVELIGHLKAVPAVYETETGHIATINIATKRYTSSNDDNEMAEWHKVVVTNQSAKFLEQYGRPGMRLMISGYLRTSTFKNNAGDIKYVTEVVAKRCDAMDSPKLEAKKELEVV